MRLIDCFSELLGYTVYITGNEPSVAVLPYEDVYHKYEDLVQRAQNTRDGIGASNNDFKEGLFAVSALIDEMILCSTFTGRDKWQASLLQYRLFNTTNAGTEFFRHMENLAPDQEDVREVYDWCLAMGFKGEYFRPEDAASLENITSQNRAPANKEYVNEYTLHMFPDAYGADRQDRHQNFSDTVIFTIILGLTPVAIFLTLFVIYNNVLKGMLARFFQ